MKGRQSRRSVLRQLATGLTVGSAALGAVGSATADHGRLTVKIRPFVRFPGTEITYFPHLGRQMKRGPTVLLEIRDAETEELVDELTLEPSDSREIWRSSPGVYTAEARIASGNGNNQSYGAVEVEGSPFRLNPRIPL